MKLKSLPPIPAVLLAIVSVQGGAAIAKTIFPTMGAAGTAGLRIVLSAIILLLAFRPKITRLTAAQWCMVVPYGMVLGAMNISFYLSLARIPLGLAVTLEFIGPLTLAVATSKKGNDYLWALLAAFGIALIAPWNGQVGIDLLGAGLALLAGAFWAAYIVLGGKAAQLMSGGDAVSIGMIFASLVVIPFAFWEGNIGKIDIHFLSIGLAIALLSSAIPYTLEMNALKHLPSKTFSILMSLEPAVAALCGLLFLSEHLSIYQWLSILSVVVASIGSTLNKVRDI
jgi:inner membrane transporter RhtA